MRSLSERALHHLPAPEVLLLLETDLDRGLSSEEVAARWQRFGPNALPRFKRHGAVIRFLLQFHHPLIYVLLAATAITGLLGEFVDAGVIFGVVTMIGLQLLLTYVPIMNRLFHTAPIDAAAWGLILFCALVVYAVVGLEKLISRRLALIEGIQYPQTQQKKRGEA
jgi:magnesium-transporting ATPase (P-type)